MTDELITDSQDLFNPGPRGDKSSGVEAYADQSTTDLVTESERRRLRAQQNGTQVAFDAHYMKRTYIASLLTPASQWALQRLWNGDPSPVAPDVADVTTPPGDLWGPA